MPLERDGGREPKALFSALETSVCLQPVVCGSSSSLWAVVWQWPLVPAVSPAVPEQAVELAALPAELCWGAKLRMSRAITRDM